MERGGFSWGYLAGIVLLIAAVFYAVQHPHSFIYYLVKILVIPIP